MIFKEMHKISSQEVSHIIISLTLLIQFYDMKVGCKILIPTNLPINICKSTFISQ